MPPVIATGGNFFLFCSRLFVSLALPKILAFGNAKKNEFSFGISLIFRNFAIKDGEDTPSRQKKN